MAAKKEKNAPKGKEGAPDKQRKSPIKDLVTAGTITQAQADSIRDAFRSARDSGKTVKEVLDSLVKAGTITKAQQDSVIKVLPCKDGKCEPHARKHGVLKDLVKDGTITQDQADAIKEAIKTGRGSE